MSDAVLLGTDRVSSPCRGGEVQRIAPAAAAAPRAVLYHCVQRAGTAVPLRRHQRDVRPIKQDSSTHGKAHLADHHKLHRRLAVQPEPLQLIQHQIFAAGGARRHAWYVPGDRRGAGVWHDNCRGRTAKAGENE